MDMTAGLRTLLLTSAIAAAAPFLAAALVRVRIPQVVIFIAGGVLIGPHVLNWADPEAIRLLADVGLGFVFLIAGYELDLELFREDVGRRALVSWLVTLVLAVGVTGVLSATGFVHAFVPIALGLTTTAFGTLLPILHDNHMLGGRLGRAVLPAGAVGELVPIIGIAIFLSSRGRFLGLISLLVMLAVALLLAQLPRWTTRPSLLRISHEGENATSQITLRLTVTLLFGLLVAANHFGLDVVLGAFLAGIILHRWAPGDIRSLESKLDAVGYGFFIPVFFAFSGMNLELRSIAQAPQRLVVFFVLLLAVRGLPAMFLYRHRLDRSERLQMVLLTATALPLLVALTEIGVSTGEMLPANAAALVGAGVLSVLIFPSLAVAVNSRNQASPAMSTSGPGAKTS
jgi:Kef-type K+ transport system membrane component KefB